jgi:putative oxidoreductase
MDSLKRLTDPVYCITRLIVGLMFACRGGQKILHFPPGGYPAKEAWGYCGGAIELVCGFLIAFGLFTRLAAFIASGEMAVVFFMFGFSGRVLRHAPTALERFLPILNGTESAVLYCWCFFFFVFYGPGRWSIDALIKRTSARTVSSTG